MNEDVETLCRFCLDSVKTLENPLIDPCDCKGSIQFVHKDCLARWRHQNIERNGEICLLCNTGYTIPLDIDLESIPEKQHIYIVLDNPILSNILLHYTWGVVRLISEASPRYSYMTNYGSFQLVTHSLLVSLMFQRTQVRNWSRYFQRWSENNRILLFFFHFLILSSSLFGSSGLSFCVSNFLLQVYWKIHIEILEEINAEVLHLN